MPPPALLLHSLLLAGFIPFTACEGSLCSGFVRRDNESRSRCVTRTGGMALNWRTGVDLEGVLGWNSCLGGWGGPGNAPGSLEVSRLEQPGMVGMSLPWMGWLGWDLISGIRGSADFGVLWGESGTPTPQQSPPVPLEGYPRAAEMGAEGRQPRAAAIFLLSFPLLAGISIRACSRIHQDQPWDK